MKYLMSTAGRVFAVAGLFGAASVAFTLPAMASLPQGRRPGLEDLTLDQAAGRLRCSGAAGWDLVEQARRLVEERMQYCRRNSYECHEVAFRRGYGFCQQQAFALADLLQKLGFDARPVYSPVCRFPNGQVLGHSWVRVSHDERTRDLDIGNTDPATGKMAFQCLRPAGEFTPAFRVLSSWGSALVNAYLYYRTHSDHDPVA